MGGLVVCGARHYDKIMIKQLQAIEFEGVKVEQGFIDNYGNFWDREAAWTIAQEAGQIIREVGGNYVRNADGTRVICKLFSENLY